MESVFMFKNILEITMYTQGFLHMSDNKKCMFGDTFTASLGWVIRLT